MKRTKGARLREEKAPPIGGGEVSLRAAGETDSGETTDRRHRKRGACERVRWAVESAGGSEW